MDNEMALVTKQQEVETAATLYGADKDLAEFCYAVKKVAPWARDLKDADVGLVVRRAVAMGLDPLNPHEVQIWRDKRGNVQFQIAYTLMAEWVKAYKGDHTAPHYVALSEAEKDEEGLEHDCMAFYAEFVMLDDLPYAARLMELGYPPDQARDMVTARGLGAAKVEEYSNPYFAPNGRSPAWKVKKRAMVDAYRCKFGTPTRPEIMELRRTGKLADVTIEDWEAAEGEADADARARLAEMNARERNRPEDTRTPEQILAENGSVLHGDEADAEWDAPKPVEESAPPPFAEEGGPAVAGGPAEEPGDDEAETEEKEEKAEQARTSTKNSKARPYDPTTLKKGLAQAVAKKPRSHQIAVATPGQRGLVAGKLEECFAPAADAEQKRHSVMEWLVGKPSSADLTMAEAGTLLDWLLDKDAAEGTYDLHPSAPAEAAAVLREALLKAGQQELPLEEGRDG